jgi:hypothetical protein
MRGQRVTRREVVAASAAVAGAAVVAGRVAPAAAREQTLDFAGLGDGSWATGFTSERDLLLRHIREHVGGQTLFVSGDTHWTMVYDRDGMFEARPCPLGIPTPNDITLTQPQVAEQARSAPGVRYADDEKGHFAFVEVSGSGRRARLELSLVREDGAVPFRRRFDAPRVRST